MTYVYCKMIHFSTLNIYLLRSRYRWNILTSKSITQSLHMCILNSWFISTCLLKALYPIPFKRQMWCMLHHKNVMNIFITWVALQKYNIFVFCNIYTVFVQSSREFFQHVFIFCGWNIPLYGKYLQPCINNGPRYIG